MSHDPVSPVTEAELAKYKKPSRRMLKMLKKMSTPQGNYARIANRITAEQRREQDLLMRDARRCHYTTRIKRALRRAAQDPTQTNEPTEPTKETKE